MGVSFKVSKTGSRFRPKPFLHSDSFGDDVSESSKQSSRPQKQGGEEVAGVSSINEGLGITKEHEVSFTLNLYPDGYSIGKPSEKEAVQQGTLQDVPKSLHPYDRASETLFSAIESGRLPGDILDNIPCKYVDGTLVCEVRDFRKCGSELGSPASATNGFPIVTKVCLRMSLENVVKDIPLISDNSWTYGDLMEVESRILKALQPQLCLDPCPKLDRLSTNPIPAKLNLALSSLRRKRLRQVPEVTVTSNNKIYGKKVCIDRVPESSHGKFEESGTISGNLMQQHVNENLTAQNHMLALRPKSFVPDASVPSVPLVSQQSRYQMGVGMSRSMQDHGPSAVVNPSGSSPSGPELVSYAENLNSTASFHPKRENQDGPMSPLSSFNKRSRLTPMGSDGFQQQQMGPSIDSLHGGDMNWKNALLQQQALTRGMQYQNTGIQKYSQQAFDGVLKQEPGTMSFAAGPPALRLMPKEEPVDTDRMDGPEFNRVRSDMQMLGTDASHLEVQQSRIQQRLPQHSFLRSGFPQTWNNIGIEKDSRKEDQFPKRKSAQSPRLSAGALPQSPLSSKSGEFSSGSVGPHFGAVATSAALVSAVKEKSAVTSVPAIGGTQSMTSSANDSMHRHHQAQVGAKRRSNSLPKTPAMSGVGSPASVSNMSVPLNANSPSVGTPPLTDQTMLERFSKIDMVATRYHLSSRKNKVDNHPIRKHGAFSPQQLSVYFANVSTNEDFKDDTKPLSKSLIGGSMNACKTRVLNFAQQEHIVQGNVVSIVRHLQRMVMLQKSNDGTVAFYFGDVEDVDFLAAEDNLPTLPNSHLADLLAAQFSSLMMREGYSHVEDHLQLKPTCTNIASSSPANNVGIAPNNPGAEMQQYADTVSGQATSSELARLTNGGNASLNSSQNLLANARMLPPGNPQAVQMSQGLLSGVSLPARPQQLDPQPSLQSQQQPQQSQQRQQPQNQHSLIQQQQQQQFQRSQMMLGPNSHSQSQLNAMGQNANMQLGSHMVNKPLQFQMLQPQQAQQQQQAQMQRKMMMGLGTVGMGNMGNNMVGLGGLGNPMSMGGPRGIGGTGMSAPMAPISSMGNVGQSPMNLAGMNISNVISQQLRSGKLTQAQAALMAAKLNKRSIIGGPQSSLAGISGARQMMPGSAGLSSMLGQNLNRPTMNTMQRTAMGPMGPPKLMAGMNLYMNQQQQQMQLQQQQQQQLQQHLQQQQIQHQQQQLQPPPQQSQQLQQQETTSPLQAVVSPSQVGSPSMGIAQLNQQPQQQLSPQQLSQRTPMSPQMSSGAIHGLSAGNPETCPASPQLSSQTLGSVGSITNSPMELQGVNKSNSVGNN